MIPRPLAIFLLAFLLPQVAPPAPTDPDKLPARDRHEGLLIAADPYTTSARTKARFNKKDPLAAGVLPIEIFLRNETSEPMRIQLATIRLVLAPQGQPHQRIKPLTLEQLITQILAPNAQDPTATRRKLPGKLSMPDKGKSWKDLQRIFEPQLLDTDIIGPNATVHGFVFFDLNYEFDWITSARLYVPDVVVMTGNRPLTYFEVPLSGSAP